MESTVSLHLSGGPFTEYRLKGRCKQCWGALIGRTGPAHVVSGIRCLVCGELLEGSAAAAEQGRLSDESGLNAINMIMGLQPKYGEGPFAQKVFPKLQKLSDQELLDRVAMSKGRYPRSPKGRLTRHEFRAGAAGWLFLQARALIDGLSRATDHHRDSIANFADFRVNADGSVSVRLDTDGLSENPRRHQQELLATTGGLLGSGMIAAFACELALKAISVTCTDEAMRTHDLLKLLDHLPRESRDRLQADFPAVRDVLTDSRGRFGEWRYFETAVGTDAFSSMIHPQRSRSLAKAARVILDEAEYVGLAGGLRVHVNRNIRVNGEERQYEDQVELTITGGECPPRP